MTTNKNISKEFRKRLDQINRWNKKQNPNITVWSQKENRYIRISSNEVWGKPDSFRMK
jgi:hypothetical protein